MVLTVDLTDDQEKILQQEAQRRGLKPTEYAKQLIADNLPTEFSTNQLPSQSLWSTLTPEQWEQQVDDWLKGNQTLPVLSEYAVSRESMYEEHE